MATLLAGLANAQELPFRFKYLNVESGLSHTDATRIVQDEQGFIWIATFSGLNRFDGYQTNPYYNQTDPQRTAYLNRLTNLYNDGSLLWISTEGGLVCFDKSSLRFVQLSGSDAASTNALHQSMDAVVRLGDIFYCIADGGRLLGFAKGENNTMRLLPAVLPAGLVFSKMTTDAKGRLWLTHNGGIVCLPQAGATPMLFTLINSAGTAATGWMAISASAGNLFTSNANGVFQLTPDLYEKFQQRGNYQPQLKQGIDYTLLGQLPAANEIANAIVSDGKGRIWTSCFSGLYAFNTTTANWETYAYNENALNGISSNYVNALMIDRSSCLWASTFGGGVNMLDLNQKPFYLLRRNPKVSNTLSGNYIRAMAEAPDGNIWIGTRTNGLNHYNKTTKQYTSFAGVPGLNDGIRSLVYDKKGRLWIGTGQGLSMMPSFGRFVSYGNQVSSGSKITGLSIFALAVDKFGRIWAGSWDNGLNIITADDAGAIQVQHIFQKSGTNTNGLSSNRITSIYADERDDIMVSTDKGLDRITLAADGSIAAIQSFTKANQTAFSSGFIWPVIRANDSVFWVGTLGGGLNKLTLRGKNDYTIEHIKDNSGKALRDVESMQLDNEGNVWLGGKTLALYKPATQSFTHYDENDGLQGNSFKIGASLHATDGTLYFGGTNGLSYFNPADIKDASLENQVVFTDLWINGNDDFSKTDDGPGAISYLNKLRLQSDQKSFTVFFSSMHFANPERWRYRYKLSGFDDNWRYTESDRHFANYDKLDYGNYTLEVEASSNDGLTWGGSRRLSIAVIPPWYQSLPAKIIYLVLLAVVAWYVYRYQVRWFKLKKSLEIKDIEEKKQEELHQTKLQFFTNISHEFRTPLTLILGPTEKMLFNEKRANEDSNYLKMIYSNARRLLGLINELMDFRKVESDSMKLAVADGDMATFANNIGSEFIELAQNRGITYNISVPDDAIRIPFDRSVLEKILVNLLANAFKYTDDGGAIKLDIGVKCCPDKPTFGNSKIIAGELDAKSLAWIRVSDNGIGITGDSINEIFDRYFRVNDSSGHDKHLGSGVGLALVKSLVQLHKGEIRVYSERNKGSEFWIGLPADIKHYSEAEINHDTEHQIDFENLYYTIDWLEGAENKTKQIEEESELTTIPQKPVVLVVEDNDDMRRFLHASLSEEYHVLEAADAETGFDLAKEHMPDGIISDYMLPGMNGSELCSLVRKELHISHTPFILVTAKASVETHLEGAEHGADIYFPKPFSIRLLQVTLRNLFESRARLKAMYAQDVFAETRQLVQNQKEKEFLDEVIGLIEDKMEEEELDVEYICRKVGMSRTKLYGKIKSVTGQPVGEFIRSLRLKKAARLLVSDNKSITEVMYEVGIQSQSYFTKAFKKHFGKTPSQFVAEFDDAIDRRKMEASSELE